MKTPELKDSLVKYLENADEELLIMIKALIENYEEEGRKYTGLSEEQYKEMDRRRLDYLKDPTQSYSWEEVRKSAGKPKK